MKQNPHQQTILRYMPLVKKIAKSLACPLYPFEDAVQDGVIGLIQACNKYSASDSDFGGLAGSYIRKHMSWALHTLIKQEEVKDLYQDHGMSILPGPDMSLIYAMNRYLSYRLTYTEINIIKMYYGLVGVTLSLRGIADLIGVSHEYVRNTRDNALRKLRNAPDDNMFYGQLKNYYFKGALDDK